MALKRYVLVIAFCFVPMPLFSNTLYFPQVAFGGGYTTTIVVMNTGLTTVSSNLQIYAPTGVLLRSIPTTISSGGSTRLKIADPGQSIISSWGMLDAGTGTVQAMATYDLHSTEGELIMTAGVSGLEAGNGFKLPVDVTVDGIALNTAIAVVNVNPRTPMTLALVLISESGSATGADTQFFTLEPGHQIVEFVTSMWPQFARGFRGTLIVSIAFSTPNSLVLTAVSLKDGLLSALPVVPDNSCAGCWD